MYQRGFVSGSYEDLYAQAERHLENREYEQAEAVFGRLHQRLSKLSATLLSRHPNLDELRVLSAEAFADLSRRKGNYQRAIEIYRQLLDTTPAARHPDWQHAVAHLKIESGLLAEGLDELRALAVALPSEPWPWLSLGHVFLDEKNYDEAVLNLKKAIARSDKNSEDRYWSMTTLFLTYKLMEQYEAAEATWLDTLAVAGNKNRDYYPLYTMYLQAGLLDKAERWLKKEQNPFRLGLHRGLLAQARGDTDAAMTHWQKTADRSLADYKMGHEDWAEAALRVNYDPAKIAKTLLAAMVDDNITRYGMVMFAVTSIRRGNFDRAHGAFADVQVMDSDLLSLREWTVFSELAGASNAEQFSKYFKSPDDDR